MKPRTIAAATIIAAGALTAAYHYSTQKEADEPKGLQIPHGTSKELLAQTIRGCFDKSGITTYDANTSAVLITRDPKMDGIIACINNTLKVGLN